MTQPTLRSQQLNSKDFGNIVGGALGAELILSQPLVAGQSLTYTGSPLAWRNAAGAGGSITAGDGLQSTAGAGSPFTGTFSVDSTVARTNVTTEEFSFAGDVSLNLNDTSQGADEDIWRISATGSSFVISTRTDADAAGNPAITFARTGTTVDTATIPAPTSLTASGTGTSSALTLSSNVPTITFNDNDSAVNAGIWDITSAPNQLLHRTRTDANGSGQTWLTVNRSGTTVGEIAFVGTSITLNGVPLQVGSPEAGGGGGLTGTVANDQVVVGTGASTVDSSANLTFDGTNLDVTGNLEINSQRALSENSFYLVLNEGSPQPFANGVWIPGESLFGGNITVDTNNAGPGIQIGDGEMNDGDVLLEFNSDARFQFLQDGNAGTASLALRSNINDNFLIQNSSGADRFTFNITSGDLAATSVSVGSPTSTASVFSKGQITGDVTVTGNVTAGSPAFEIGNVYFVKLTSDDTVNNTTTLTDSGLLIRHVRSGYYAVHGLLLFRDVAVSGCGARFDITGGGPGSNSALRVQNKNFSGSGAVSFDEMGLFTDEFNGLGLVSGSGTSRFMLDGNVEYVSSGTMQLQFAQNTAQVGDLDLESGSWIALTRLGDA